MSALAREWRNLDAAQLSQLLFALSKWGCAPPAPLLQRAAALLLRQPEAFDGPAVCSVVNALARCGGWGDGAAVGHIGMRDRNTWLQDARQLMTAACDSGTHQQQTCG